VPEQEQIISDDDLIRSVQEGRIRYFEVLVDRYKKKIINFIHKMIFDYDEAQSLTQDVFLKVFENLQRYKAQDNFQAFIYTIARNLTFNHIKKQKRISWFSGSLPNQTEEKYFRSEETQHASLEQSRQEEIITKGLKSLKENQRLALILKVYLELPYNRIAEITGWSIPKIETLISRARSNLKTIIQEHMQTLNSPAIIDPTHRHHPLQENSSKKVIEMRST